MNITPSIAQTLIRCSDITGIGVAFIAAALETECCVIACGNRRIRVTYDGTFVTVYEFAQPRKCHTRLSERVKP